MRITFARPKRSGFSRLSGNESIKQEAAARGRNNIRWPQTPVGAILLALLGTAAWLAALMLQLRQAPGLLVQMLQEWEMGKVGGPARCDVVPVEYR